MKIEEILVKDIKYEEIKRKKPAYSLLSATKCNEYRSKIEEDNREVYKFEKRVFIHLFENRDDLGIEKIYTLKNMRVDATLKLDSEKVILLEIKYALNWKNCCNARVEVQRFVEEGFYRQIPGKQQPEGALIEYFSGDWQRKKPYHKHENGWNYFYEEEEILRNKLPTIPIDIAQLTNEGLKEAPQRAKVTHPIKS